jgi:hypothetical protein
MLRIEPLKPGETGVWGFDVKLAPGREMYVFLNIRA